MIFFFVMLIIRERVFLNQKNGGTGMSELKELIKQIEEQRARLIKIHDGKVYSDPEVVTTSQQLDAILDKYQALKMKKVQVRIKNVLEHQY